MGTYGVLVGGTDGTWGHQLALMGPGGFLWGPWWHLVALMGTWWHQVAVMGTWGYLWVPMGTNGVLVGARGQ